MARGCSYLGTLEAGQCPAARRSRQLTWTLRKVGGSRQLTWTLRKVASSLGPAWGARLGGRGAGRRERRERGERRALRTDAQGESVKERGGERASGVRVGGAVATQQLVSVDLTIDFVMEILDIVVNPSGGDSDDELSEQELHVADSLVPRELKLIGSAIGTERSVLFTWLKLHLLVMFVYFAFFGQELGDVTLFGRVTPWTPHGYAPNGLGQMKYACESVAFLSMFLPLQALRHAVAQGGELEQLGAGTKKISTTDAANLRRWRIGLMAPLGMIVPMTVFLFVTVLPVTIIELITGECPYSDFCNSPFFVDGNFDSKRFGRRIKFIISPVSKSHDLLHWLCNQPN